jgi:flavin-dependent dehydrogenase
MQMEVGFPVAGYVYALMSLQTTYDVAVAGGGLAGLAFSIQMAREGYSVVLFEKEKYPFHKVCGEYLSLESAGFLQRLGLPIRAMDLPIIKTLLLTAPNGASFRTSLPLGGTGISRKLLDQSLAQLAVQSGVTLCEETRVEQVERGDEFRVQYHSKQLGAGSIEAKLCCGSFGKKSNLDVKWDRDFLKKQDKRLDNYIAVKYHISAEWPQGLIGLHNFENGYCGISEIEQGKHCLCYMTRAESLRRNGNSIAVMERQLLSANPHLQKIFSSMKVLEEFPLTISQISFTDKSRHHDGMLLLGDAAGMITPLCGNGMSMALHSGKIGAELAVSCLKGKIGVDDMCRAYEVRWKKEFGSRMRMGRMLQRFFGSRGLSNFFVGSFKTFPFLATPVIRTTHGKPF